MLCERIEYNVIKSERAPERHLNTVQVVGLVIDPGWPTMAPKMVQDGAGLTENVQRRSLGGLKTARVGPESANMLKYKAGELFGGPESWGRMRRGIHRFS